MVETSRILLYVEPITVKIQLEYNAISYTIGSYNIRWEPGNRTEPAECCTDNHLEIISVGCLKACSQLGECTLYSVYKYFQPQAIRDDCNTVHICMVITYSGLVVS